MVEIKKWLNDTTDRREVIFTRKRYNPDLLSMKDTEGISVLK